MKLVANLEERVQADHIQLNLREFAGEGNDGGLCLGAGLLLLGITPLLEETAQATLRAQTLDRSPSPSRFQPIITSVRKSRSADSTALSNLRQGPLGPHLDSFADLLSQQGYCKQTAWNKIRLVADLSRWLEPRGGRLKQLDEQQITTFLETRWKRVPHRSGDQATMSLLLRQLRQSQVIPTPGTEAATQSAIELIERHYERFLVQERGLMWAAWNSTCR